MTNHHATATPVVHRLLTPEQTADILGVGVETLRTWRREGRGPAWVRYSPRVARYSEGDLAAFLDANRQTG